jgi:hypothetical protein
VILADRETVEQGADQILEAAKSSDVAFLVVGDPFGFFPVIIWSSSVLCNCASLVNNIRDILGTL